MRIAIILNGISGKKGKFRKRILPQLEENFSVEVFETTSGEDAFQFAASSVAQKFDIILAAGGDGTLHQVVNGMLKGNEGVTDLPVLGLIPLGTGNDFARTMNLKSDSQSLINAIAVKNTRPIDIGKVHFTNDKNGQTESRYFINVVDAGMGPDVVKRIAAQRTFLGIPYSYFMAILKTFLHYKLIRIAVKTSTGEWQGRARAVAVANGRYFGQGLCIAPDATIDDQRFETFICAEVSVFDFIRYSIPLKRGKRVDHKEVHYGSCSHMELTAEEPCGIEADGEYLGMLPARIGIIDTPIQFLV